MTMFDWRPIRRDEAQPPGTKVGKVLAVVLLVGLVGCASKTPDPEQAAREQAKDESIEDILNTPLASEDYAAEERCLSIREYDNVDVLDDQHVLFRGRGDNMWINKLRHRCVGLRENDTLSFKLHDTRVCDLDTFEAVSTFYWSIKSGSCSLGGFMPVTKEQVDAIKLAVKESKQSGK